MATVSTPQYLIDQARRRLTPTLNTIPGMGLLDEKLRMTAWQEFVFAEPPPGSGLKPVMGNAGLPVMGHLIEVFRGGPDYVLETYRKFGPVHYSKTPALNAVAGGEHWSGFRPDRIMAIASGAEQSAASVSA